jgi:CubicO group peptidase (beta-lactamase class C family)
MSLSQLSRSKLLAIILLALCATLPVAGGDLYPGKTWKHGSAAGWSREKLKAARDYSATIKTAAVMIVEHGAVVDEWGETDRKFNCHSMRKSLLSALYGIHVQAGHVRLSKTLTELGIDDNAPSLTVAEKQATIHDLLKARSGIYHPALYETPSMTAAKPPRGSHAPGTFWHYNNWDFNALGTIFEQETGTKIFEEFARRIARPLMMQDFTTADGNYFRGELSNHPAYPFRMTARDLARFGYLFLRQGVWKGRQIVPKEWVRESTTSYSETGNGEGYGYMWWIEPEGFSARGAGGHYVVVLPKQDLVVVHRVNTDVGENSVSHAEFRKLMALLLEAASSTQAILSKARIKARM